MSNRTEVTVSRSTTTELDMTTTPAPAIVARRDVTRDFGRVRYGAGAMPFTTTKDSGRVSYGAGAMPFTTTKDAGRVRYGAGAMPF